MRKLPGTFILAVIALLIAPGPVRADVELVLKNGTVMPGVDLERRGGTYLVRMQSGQVVEVPIKLVASVRLSGTGVPEPDTDAEARPALPRPGLRVDDASTVAGQTVAPPDTEARVKQSDPATLAGQDVAGPDVPAYPDRGGGEAPRAGVIAASPATVSDPRTRDGELPPGVWVPRDDWGESDWPRAADGRRPAWNGAASPTWTPESGLRPDASNFNPTRWPETPDATWKPTDGFRKTNTSLSSGAAAAGPAADPGETAGYGVASWYGNELEGGTTASGRPFHMAEFTAASPDLPFGSLVLVTNLANRKNILVEVTDRVAPETGRVINLSRAAAGRLDMIEPGLAPVSMEVVPTATPAAGSPAPDAAP